MRNYLYAYLCDQLCSVEHLLTECVDLIEWRRQFFDTDPLKMLFLECSPDNIVQFVNKPICLTNCDSTIVHPLSGVLFNVNAAQ